MNAVYGIQQTEETLRQNIANWQSLHTNKDNSAEMNAYNADKLRKHKIRLIEACRKRGRV